MFVWLALLGLSIYRGAAVPFFVIAAGPILALNLAAYAARRPARQAKPARRALGPRGLLAARAAALLALAALTAAAWAGWLQTTFEPRRWSVPADPALVDLSRQMVLPFEEIAEPRVKTTYRAVDCMDSTEDARIESGDFNFEFVIFDPSAVEFGDDGMGVLGRDIHKQMALANMLSSLLHVGTSFRGSGRFT